MSTVVSRNVVCSLRSWALDSSANQVIRDLRLKTVEPFQHKRGPRTSGVSEADYPGAVSPPCSRSIPAFPRKTNVSGATRLVAAPFFTSAFWIICFFTPIDPQLLAGMYFFFLFCFDRAFACVHYLEQLTSVVPPCRRRRRTFLVTCVSRFPLWLPAATKTLFWF